MDARRLKLMLLGLALLPFFVMGQQSAGGSPSCGDRRISNTTVIEGDEGPLEALIYPTNVETGEVVLELDTEGSIEAGLFGTDADETPLVWELTIEDDSIVSSLGIQALNFSGLDVLARCEEGRLRVKDECVRKAKEKIKDELTDSGDEDTTDDSSTDEDEDVSQVFGKPEIRDLFSVEIATPRGETIRILPTLDLDLNASLDDINDNLFICAAAANHPSILEGKSPCEAFGDVGIARAPARFVIKKNVTQLQNSLTIQLCGEDKTHWDLETEACEPSNGAEIKPCVRLGSCYNRSTGVCHVVVTDTSGRDNVPDPLELPLFAPNISSYEFGLTTEGGADSLFGGSGDDGGFAERFGTGTVGRAPGSGTFALDNTGRGVGSGGAERKTGGGSDGFDRNVVVDPFGSICPLRLTGFTANGERTSLLDRIISDPENQLPDEALAALNFGMAFGPLGKSLAPYISYCGMPTCAAAIDEDLDFSLHFPTTGFFDVFAIGQTCNQEFTELSILNQNRFRSCLQEVGCHMCHCMELGRQDKTVTVEGNDLAAGAANLCCGGMLDTFLRIIEEGECEEEDPQENSCGNQECEPLLGEDIRNCPEDCFLLDDTGGGSDGGTRGSVSTGDTGVGTGGGPSSGFACRFGVGSPGPGEVLCADSSTCARPCDGVVTCDLQSGGPPGDDESAAICTGCSAGTIACPGSPPEAGTCGTTCDTISDCLVTSADEGANFCVAR